MKMFVLEAKQISFSKLEDNTNSLENDLAGLGVKPEKIEWLLSEFTQDHLERNIRYTQNRLITGDVTHPHSYVVKAIQKDYAQVSQESKRINSKKGAKKELVPDFIAQARDKEQILKGGLEAPFCWYRIMVGEVDRNDNKRMSCINYQILSYLAYLLQRYL